MAELTHENLQRLTAYVGAARGLKEELIGMIVSGALNQVNAGDAALASFNVLVDSIGALTDEGFVKALSRSVPEKAGDLQKVVLVILALGQLVGYLDKVSKEAKGQEARQAAAMNDLGGIDFSDLGKGLDALAERLGKLIGGEQGRKVAEAIRNAVPRQETQGQ